MLSLILSAFLAQNQATEAPVEDLVVFEDIVIECGAPMPDVTIFVTMLEPQVDEEIQLEASFVEKIPQSLD